MSVLMETLVRNASQVCSIIQRRSVSPVMPIVLRVMVQRRMIVLCVRMLTSKMVRLVI